MSTPASIHVPLPPRLDESGQVTISGLVSFRIHQVANLLARSAAMRYRREHGVSMMEWRAIALLGANAPLSLNELSRLANLDKSQTSRTISALAARRLVLRAADRNDARGVQLSLSAAGRRLYQQLISTARERNLRLLDALTVTERKVLDTLLDKLAVKARELIREERLLDEAETPQQ